MAKSLIEQRLAACVQIEGPMTSVYRWQGSVEEALEWRWTIKTLADRFVAVRDHILSQHSYEVPEILATEISHASDSYRRWLEEQVP